MKKIGILGGGQLGKMLCLAAANWDVETWVLDKAGSPAASYCKHFVEGDYNNFDDVVQFGKNVDVLTIEIEHVEVEALKFLEKNGLPVHPNPDALQVIKDKFLQKMFYKNNNLPTAEFHFFEDKTALKKDVFFPSVWKMCTGGYDGKGVSILKQPKNLDILPDVPCFLEKMVDFDLEIAVLVCRNELGEIMAYPPVEMVFDEKENLLDYQICPARIADEVAERAQMIAKNVIEKFNISGLLAVEMFLTKSSEILINEVAPRPHNSGHHTIEAVETSQFEQHLRAILNFPLGSTANRMPSVMVNLLGAEGQTGATHISDFSWQNALNTEGVHIHLYGKTTTKPMRKMGHATILDHDISKALEKAAFVKEHFKIESK